MRKIRVICNDPYATDCSSDDEESIEIRRTNGKLFVQEISVLIPSIHQLSLDATDSSSREDRSAKDGPICINQEIGSTVAENHRSLGKEKHLGIKKTSSGKWDVQIHHPTEGTTRCLGSHNTFEEAMNVYEEKKLEFVLLSKLIKQKKPVMQSAKRKRQKFVLDDLTISETASGKWAAWVMDPISNRKIWMGIYATPEEVVISYCRKKHDFDSSSNPKNLGKGSSSVQGNPHDSATNNTSSPAQDIASPMDTDVASLKRPGIKLTRTGRWGVTIYHPTLKCRYWLGSYDTPEEAAKVFDKKKTELEAGSGSHGAGAGAAAEVVNQESCSLGKRKLTDASTVVIDSQGHLHVAAKGIRLRQSGRWAAEIKDPFKGKNTHIGTFDTPEEAADAYSKRKRELNEMMSLGKKQKCKGKAEADKVGVSLEADDVGAVIKTEPNNASPSFTLEAENSTVTAVSSQNSEGSNTKTNNDKQIPGSSLSAEDEFGFSVINSYGQLIGEYSRIDDELWLSGPGDYDECVVVHGTQNLVLDHKPSFSPTSLGI